MATKFSGRYDAGIGAVLLGDGKGMFTIVPSVATGFKVSGDAKALARLKGSSGKEMIIASQNLDSLRVFTRPDTLMETFLNPLPQMLRR